MRPLPLISLFLLHVGCSSGSPRATDKGGAAIDDTAGEDGGAPEPEYPPAASGDLCQRVTAGPASTEAPAAALSRAHADWRLFGDAPDFPTADSALIAALSAGSVDAPQLDAYAAAQGGCRLEARAVGLGPASVAQVGAWAWVKPGLGAVTLPAGARGVVVDLRDLPADPALADVLAAAVAPALGSSVTLPSVQIRRWSGFVDQVFSETNVYSTRRFEQPGAEIAALGSVDLPLVLVTDVQMAPAASRIAAGLTLSGRAWIIGEDVMTAVGELHWSALPSQGLLWRFGQLRWDGNPLPDTLPATVRTDDPEGMLAEDDGADWPAPEIPAGASTSAELPDRDPFNEAPPAAATTVAELQAALLVGHGVLRRFYPYFDVVGDDLDGRLLEVLAADLDPADRPGMVRTIGRLGEALHDGHVFFGDIEDPGPAGYLPVVLDHIDGQPVVVRTTLDEVSPGDTLTAINGVPIEEVYAELLTWNGAASPGYALDLAGRRLLRLEETTTYTLRSPEGGAREVTVDPRPEAEIASLSFVFHDRESGTLDDLGAPDILYLNVDYQVGTSLSTMRSLISAAIDAGAIGLVVDMRGYPGVNHYQLAQSLYGESFQSPIFNVDLFDGPDVATVITDQYTQTPASVAWTGAIVLLTSPVTVSAAENFSQMLVGRPGLSVVGRPSAATNGNITGMRLPGGFELTFTGMEVLNPDGGPFHGIGVVPTVEVGPTAADYAAGADPELEAAMALLRGLGGG